MTQTRTTVALALLAATLAVTAINQTPVQEEPLYACNAKGSLYLYNTTDPFVTARTNFTPTHKNFFLLTGGTNPPEVLQNGTKLPLTHRIHGWPNIYNTTVDPSTLLTTETNLRVRGVQGYVTQPEDDHPFDPQRVLDVHGKTKTFERCLTQGTYAIPFFDKYSINKPGQGKDNRPISVQVSRNGDIIHDVTHRSPHPEGTEGAAVVNFDVNSTDWYNITVTSVDSSYTHLPQCTAAEALCNTDQDIRAACDLDMAIIIDSSGSISGHMQDVKDALKPFAEAFATQTNTEITVIEFDKYAEILQDYTDDRNKLNDAISQPTAGGTTNWEDALRTTHSLFDHRQDIPDLYLFASDGKPRAYLDDDGNVISVQGHQKPLEEATEAADEIKNDGVTLYGIGVANLNKERMEKIATENRVITSDFDTLASDLADVAGELCKAQIEVTTNTNGTPAPGWNVTVAKPERTKQTGQDGTAVFDFELTQPRTMNVTETVKDGYILDNATCRAGAETRGTRIANGTANVTLRKGDTVACTFNNSLYTYCGDGTVQQPNSNGVIEACDGTAGLEEHEACTDTCTIVTNVTCAEQQQYLIHNGATLNKSITEIFETHGANMSNYNITANASILNVSVNTTRFIAAPNGLTGTTQATITAENDTVGPTSCTFNATHIPLACDTQECRDCTTDTCLRSNNCLDTTLDVPDPNRKKRPQSLLPLPGDQEYTVFASTSTNFSITPAQGKASTVYTMTSNAPHNTQGIATFQLQMDEIGSIQACIGLTRIDQLEGNGTPTPETQTPPPDVLPPQIQTGGVEPRTDYLVIGSRAVSPYYEESGTVTPMGPYVYTAKVWVR